MSQSSLFEENIIVEKYEMKQKALEAKNYLPPYDQWMRDLAFNIDDNVFNIIYRSLLNRGDKQLSLYGYWIQGDKSLRQLIFVTKACNLSIRFTVMPKMLSILIHEYHHGRHITDWLYHGDDPELLRLLQVERSEELTLVTDALAEKMSKYTLAYLKQYNQGI